MSSINRNPLPSGMGRFKSPLEQVEQIEYFIRQLTKVDSKMNAGQFISAYRENRRIIAELEQIKQKIIAQDKASSK